MLDDFFVRALFAGIGVAVTTGPLGCFVVWRRMAYFGDAMAHAALLGVALGLAAELGTLLGVLIVVIEGMQSLNQYYHNWITYRATCEELKHEKYLWLSLSGPYRENGGDPALLAERTEALISREHSRWVAEREKGRKTERRADT